MDKMTKAESLRKMADHFDEIAKISNDIGDSNVASHYRNIAEHLREQVDKIDPPQPEWQDGDLARDRCGNVWEYMLGLWYCQGTSYRTEALTRDCGPLTRVLTYDPAKQTVANHEQQEVVVSVDGLDREELDSWETLEEFNYSVSGSRAAFRISKAAREQLGEVQ